MFIFTSFKAEEIDDIDASSIDPFVAATIVANEKDLALSEEQKKNYRKVCTHLLLFFYLVGIFDCQLHAWTFNCVEWTALHLSTYILSGLVYC